MPHTFAVLALFSLLAQRPNHGVVTLALPHALREGETASLIVTAGVLRHGDEIEITTSSGRRLGVISPYGIPPGNEAGTYVLPLPPDAFRRTRLSLRLSIHTNGRERPPTKKEVKRVRVEVVRVK